MSDKVIALAWELEVKKVEEEVRRGGAQAPTEPKQLEER